MSTLFLAWQDQSADCRRWYPVGRLTFDGRFYEFAYTKGALEAKAISGFEATAPYSDFDKRYSAEELFPLFSNRILAPNRKDFQQYQKWLHLPQETEFQPLSILGRSGGEKATDSFQVFPCPERDLEGNYVILFFVHGIRYLPPETKRIVENLLPGDELALVPEPENPFDQWAIKVVSQEASIGYCPRFLNRDLHKLQRANNNAVAVYVERLNDNAAPAQFKLLCRVVTKWPDGFVPFSDDEFQLIS